MRCTREESDGGNAEICILHWGERARLHGEGKVQHVRQSQASKTELPLAFSSKREDTLRSGDPRVGLNDGTCRQTSPQRRRCPVGIHCWDRIAIPGAPLRSPARLLWGVRCGRERAGRPLAHIIGIFKLASDGLEGIGGSNESSDAPVFADESQLLLFVLETVD